MLVELPYLLKRMFTSENAFSSLLTVRYVVLGIMVLVYLLHPLDILPEAVVGPIGYIDDFLSITCFLLLIANDFVRNYTRNM